MSSGISFWKRVGSAFRANGDEGNGNGNGAGAAVEAADPVAGSGGKASSGALSVSSLLPWVRRGRSYRQLDERYQRVVELLDTMRDHFDRQDRRAEELTGGVDRLGSTLEQLASTQRTQSECVASLVARVDEAARYSAGLAALVRELPASMRNQTEAIQAVAQQMEATRATNTQLVGSLERFSRAADALCDAGSNQAAAVRRFHEASERQAESIHAFARSQTRLLMIVTTVVAVLGVGILAALGLVVRMLFTF